MKLQTVISGYFSRNCWSIRIASSRLISCRVPMGSSTVMPTRALSCVGKNSVLITGIKHMLAAKMPKAERMTVLRWRTDQSKKRA